MMSTVIALFGVGFIDGLLR